jgi:hypothetical protein
MVTDWMWNDDGAVWGLSLNLDTQRLEWSDSLGCACSGGFAEQSAADFLAHGPRYGQPPPAVVAAVRAVLLRHADT